MPHTLAVRQVFVGLGRFAEHAAVVVVGLILMILGLGLGVTMLMLPVGIVIGFVGRSSRSWRPVRENRQSLNSQDYFWGALAKYAHWRLYLMFVRPVGKGGPPWSERLSQRFRPRGIASGAAPVIAWRASRNSSNGKTSGSASEPASGDR
jgi:hypothetical protein